MIVGAALQRVFQGKMVSVTFNGSTSERALQFGYGDQKELIAWVNNKDRSQQAKYPLLWYVVSDHKKLNGVVDVETQFIVLTDTQHPWLNPTRSQKTYTNIIEPVFEFVKAILRTHKYINVIGRNLEEKYRDRDIPNWGVSAPPDKNDFVNKGKQGEESISTDIVDGKVISLRMKLQIDCI